MEKDNEAKKATWNIIGRKPMEEELRFANMVLSIQAEASIDGSIVVDKLGKITSFNQRFIEIWGISPEIIESRSDKLALQSVLDKLVDPEEFLARVNYLYQNKEEKSSEEILLLDKRILERYSAPMIESDGKYYGRVWSFRDITERKRAEEERLKIQKLESLGVMAGGIAHDFNNLLAGIMGNVSLLPLENNCEVRKKLIGEVIIATKRAAELTQKLLAFSKGSVPKIVIGSISEVIRDSADFALGKSSSAICKLDLPDDLLLVEMDPGQISRVIQNLVINADQAMPEGGVIQIKAKNLELPVSNIFGLEEGPFVQISVRDAGGGIPEKYLGKIFDPYFTTKGEGSGLGLAVAYTVIKNHRGTISVKSRLEEGTTFYILIPATRQKITAEPIPRDCEIPQELKILLMDDNDLIRDMGQHMIEGLGYQIELAENGKEAVEKYFSAFGLNKPFDLVILDLTIPGGMGGVETLEKLLEIDPKVKAIVSSGYSETVDTQYFKGYLAKPYGFEDLKNAIGKVFQ